MGGRPIHGEATRWTIEGVQQLKARHLPEAVNAFEKAADADPNHPVVWNNLGTAYLALDHGGKAEGAFKRAIGLDPNYALAHYNLGSVRDAALDYDGAISSYARALELDPKLDDPAVNPAIVNNTHLAAVHLILYRKLGGTLGGSVTTIDNPGPKSKAGASN